MSSRDACRELHLHLTPVEGTCKAVTGASVNMCGILLWLQGVHVSGPNPGPSPQQVMRVRRGINC